LSPHFSPARRGRLTANHAKYTNEFPKKLFPAFVQLRRSKGVFRVFRG
jgi:hypothetical protein